LRELFWLVCKCLDGLLVLAARVLRHPHFVICPRQDCKVRLAQLAEVCPSHELVATRTCFWITLSWSNELCVSIRHIAIRQVSMIVSKSSASAQFCARCKNARHCAYRVIPLPAVQNLAGTSILGLSSQRHVQLLLLLPQTSAGSQRLDDVTHAGGV